jgi:HPt (histidine-containing phosphotransfer) domain-containing protein
MFVASLNFGEELSWLGASIESAESTIKDLRDTAQPELADELQAHVTRLKEARKAIDNALDTMRPAFRAFEQFAEKNEAVIEQSENAADDWKPITE